MFGPKDTYKSVSTVDTKGPGKGVTHSASTAIAAGRGKWQSSTLAIARRDAGESSRANLLKELSDPFGAAQIRAVSSCLNLATMGLSTTLALWCLGFGAVLIRVANPDLISNSFLNSYWVIFTPFWLGDCVAMVFQVRLLLRAYLLRFLTPEQQVAVRRRYGSISPSEGGSIPSIGLPAELQGLGLGPLGQSTIVDVAYMPLVQRTVFATVMSIPLLLLLIGQQVLACVQLSTLSEYSQWSKDDMKFSMMICLSPLLVLETFGLLRVLLIRTRSVLPLATWFLIFLGTLCVAAKIDGIKEVLLADGPWIMVLSPFLALIALFGGLVVYIFIGALFRKFELTRSQRVSLLLYFLSLISLTGGIALLAAKPAVLQILDYDGEVREEAPVVAIWSAAVLASLGLCIAVEGSMHRLMNTKGFEDPVPLSKTSKGWEPSGARNEHWTLLGMISVRDKAPGTAHKAKGNAEIDNNNRNISDISTGEWNHEEEARIPEQIIRRNDSGSYDDICDKL
jgi:hypothetical protein